ncbi:hypothetical protein MUN82_04075 [Hymenobacter aerilatus]|uniref:Uncharacterized protein n=1 Tax=Hymenobacter aerilatus TaxID=2932251 RepID=A0A8T9SX15_9BACT|nr:hypothetical protein [Hymenobacter aerilatus]UOR06277.1 hypothetical protein MUN82_04075 [Hymenobacter aerilatus]
MKHILQKVQGETNRQEKERFKEALAEVVPHMDHFFSRMTKRKFPNRTLLHIQHVKQRAVIDWDVLAYWFEEFMPQPVEA